MGVEKILMGFNLISFLRSSVEGLLSGKFRLSCNEIAPDFNSPTNQWVIGKGAKEEPGVPLSTILESANLASSIAESFINTGEAVDDLVKTIGSLDFFGTGFSNPGFKGLISDCYGGPPLNCGGVKVKIFGSAGSGAVANAVIGSIVGDGENATGSIVGFDILDGGSGYDFPPFIEIVDDCKQGYGAVARSIIDYDENLQLMDRWLKFTLFLRVKIIQLQIEWKIQVQIHRILSLMLQLSIRELVIAIMIE